ncbi:metallophosphoesterase family protein [Neobacillus sp. LXY-4]|uniref:metallophosphoesterase family protein n=1 Tax=Neobacillus sp. LXY-4 TaxID=3379826 RepID=UPI003EE34EE2
MTKILIVSDSHRWSDELEAIKQRHVAEVDLMVHCGDSELAADQPEISGFVTVRGNCDYEKQFPEEAQVEIDGFKVYVTHGHLFGVKSTLMNLYYRAKEVGADIVCFGHSHILGMEMIDGMLFINPGSIRLPRGRKERSYCVLEFKEDEVEILVYDLQKGEIAELRQRFPLSTKK